MYKLFILLLLISFSLCGQTKFISSKYNYSFIIPEGWHVKDQIFNPDVDAKIVDGKGNSFIVSIKTFPTAENYTAAELLQSNSDKELEEQFNAVFGTTKIVKKGIVQIDFKDFCYLHLLTPFQKGLNLYHKQFLFNSGKRMLTIDACSIETYMFETTPAFAIMIDTFRFSDLKNKSAKK
jgi:hypothetical protein